MTAGSKYAYMVHDITSQDTIHRLALLQARGFVSAQPTSEPLTRPTVIRGPRLGHVGVEVIDIEESAPEEKDIAEIMAVDNNTKPARSNVAALASSLTTADPLTPEQVGQRVTRA